MFFGWHPSTPSQFFVFFALLLCTVSFIVATLGGWRRLAEVYRLEGTFEGVRWRFKSGRMRWGANYNNCLTVGANERGLYLAVLFPFGLFHPRLFVPRSDVGVTQKKGWVFKYCDFTFLKAPGVSLRLQQHLGLALLQAGHQELG